jgi:hypothetical protein
LAASCRSKEIVIATRGTDINAALTHGPTGHGIHKGFGTTFKSYVQQLNEFIKQQNLGFKPTAVHCMANSSWLQMQSLTQAKQQQLENSLYLGQSPEADYIDKLAKMPGAMFSGRLLKLINKAIHEMLANLATQPTHWPMLRWPPFAGCLGCCTSRSAPWPSRPFSWWGADIPQLVIRVE